MKRVGFLGCDSTDIVLYVARLLQAEGKKVRLLDYTEQHMLLRVAMIPEECLYEENEYRGISVAAGFQEEGGHSEETAYVLCYFGNQFLPKQFMQCSAWVLITDMLPYHADLFSVLPDSPAEKICIIRNAISLKYDEQYLIKRMKQIVSKEQMFLLPYEEKDYKSSCYLGIDYSHKMVGLSYEMKQLLTELIEWLMERTEHYTRREFAALLKRA